MKASATKPGDLETGQDKNEEKAKTHTQTRRVGHPGSGERQSEDWPLHEEKSGPPQKAGSTKARSGGRRAGMKASATKPGHLETGQDKNEEKAKTHTQNRRVGHAANLKYRWSRFVGR